MLAVKEIYDACFLFALWKKKKWYKDSLNLFWIFEKCLELHFGPYISGPRRGLICLLSIQRLCLWLCLDGIEFFFFKVHLFVCLHWLSLYLDVWSISLECDGLILFPGYMQREPGDCGMYMPQPLRGKAAAYLRRCGLSNKNVLLQLCKHECKPYRSPVLNGFCAVATLQWNFCHSNSNLMVFFQPCFFLFLFLIFTVLKVFPWILEEHIGLLQTSCVRYLKMCIHILRRAAGNELKVAPWVRSGVCDNSRDTLALRLWRIDGRSLTYTLNGTLKMSHSGDAPTLHILLTCGDKQRPTADPHLQYMKLLCLH